MLSPARVIQRVVYHSSREFYVHIECVRRIPYLLFTVITCVECAFTVYVSGSYGFSVCVRVRVCVCVCVFYRACAQVIERERCERVCYFILLLVYKLCK